MARQCELLGLCRASYYYRPVEVGAEELALLRRLAEQYTRTPFGGVAIERVDHVWSTDITYIRLWSGFAYLASVMDWHSRYVLS